ncbi:nucleotidyltransferase domain-containing protein [Larkinella rosea]|uniref:Nucleotidyltransferase domain-containing protein n=1 Tax=Larkinella rosea TaxID=2025312 RepID=A0A3P1BJJ4_9BACT|nr:nucleotidyltransferase domain-containing protein [Larkinella rosea]RRB01076.1 nucleotidyltransferase domain-containing protein [Larkinella rosea]
MPYGLDDTDLNAITAVLARNHRVGQAILFGSRAKGSHRPGSDIDIALKGPELTFDDLLNLSVALDDLWLPLRFDLVLYDRINEPALREQIQKTGQVLLSKSFVA